MSVTCPSGHTSDADDWCDQCGLKIGGPTPAAPAAPTGKATAATVACPTCQAPHAPNDQFCESCGTNLKTGLAPAAPLVPPVVDPAAPTIAQPGGRWSVVVEADATWHAKAGTDLPFPEGVASRTFPLTAQEVRVGRHGSTAGHPPEIDLGGAVEDSAVSHLHLVLLRQADGTYDVVDPGSTNGTHVGDSTDPIQAGTPHPVADGTQLHIGAWTTLTIRRAEA